MRTLLATILLIGVSLHAQWIRFETPGIPRTPDGKPDLSCLWNSDFKNVTNLAFDLKDEDLAMRPEALQLYRQRMDGSHGKEESDASCLPQGLPKSDATPVPWKIIQGPGQVTILYGAFTLFREIFTDGRELPQDPNPTWLGYSVGYWDGDTLVVESSVFNGKTWLDQVLHPTRDALHVTEPFRRKTFGLIELEITIDDPKMYGAKDRPCPKEGGADMRTSEQFFDLGAGLDGGLPYQPWARALMQERKAEPKAYTKPWTVAYGITLMPDTEMLEYVCNENNKDVQHLVGK